MAVLVLSNGLCAGVTGFNCGARPYPGAITGFLTDGFPTAPAASRRTRTDAGTMEVSALSFCANGLLTTVEAAEIVLFVSLLPEESCGFPGDIVGGGATGSAFAPCGGGPVGGRNTGGGMCGGGNLPIGPGRGGPGGGPGGGGTRPSGL